MKQMKKLLAILLAVMMMLSMGMTAMAEDGTGSITINGVSEKVIYEVYKLLDLESYDTTAGAYSYKVNGDWTGFFATEEALPLAQSRPTLMFLKERVGIEIK